MPMCDNTCIKSNQLQLLRRVLEAIGVQPNRRVFICTNIRFPRHHRHHSGRGYKYCYLLTPTIPVLFPAWPASGENTLGPKIDYITYQPGKYFLARSSSSRCTVLSSSITYYVHICDIITLFQLSTAHAAPDPQPHKLQITPDPPDKVQKVRSRTASFRHMSPNTPDIGPKCSE